MQKIAIDSLTVEVTRRCNMTPICAHCFRGKPQNIDLSSQAIDNLLDQIVEIGDLNITGGEPMLHLSAIRHIFEKIKEKRIELTRFVMTTNALLCPDEFIELIKDLDTYIHSQEKPIEFYEGVYINYSVDKYHNNSEGALFMEKCSLAFRDTKIKVIEEMSGGIPAAVGNAKLLPEAAYHSMFHTQIHKIEFRSDGVIPFCPTIQEYEEDRYAEIFDYDKAALILCPLYLNAKGLLYTTAANNEYVVADQLEPICDMNKGTEVFGAIQNYNVGKPFCFQCKAKPTSSKELVKQQINRQIQINNFMRNPLIAPIKEDREKATEIRNELIATQKAHPRLSLDEVVKICGVNYQLNNISTKSKDTAVLLAEMEKVTHLENERSKKGGNSYTGKN